MSLQLYIDLPFVSFYNTLYISTTGPHPVHVFTRGLFSLRRSTVYIILRFSLSIASSEMRIKYLPSSQLVSSDVITMPMISWWAWRLEATQPKLRYRYCEALVSSYGWSRPCVNWAIFYLRS